MASWMLSAKSGVGKRQSSLIVSLLPLLLSCVQWRNFATCGDHYLQISFKMRAVLKRRAGGPSAPASAIVGGIPNSTLDVPLTVFFLMLFLIGGAFHFYTHEVNRKRQHKFHLSALMFDFCLVRTITCTLRIVWKFKPDDANLILTALIFENAG